jgi:PhzF family phenazine biosynthesis protein
MQRRFLQLDVFGSDGFSGNPLAVVVDSEGLSTDDMLEITDWMNLSETTFLVPPTDPEADYHVRIFCPGRELPFAGHPTLGSCRAWLTAGGSPKRPDRIVQQCGAGLVPIGSTGDRLAFAAPSLLREGPVAPDELAERLAQLGLAADDVVEAAWIDNGPGWMGLLLESAEAVLAVALPSGSIPGFNVGLIGPHPEGHPHAVEVRGLFEDSHGHVREDPVTGSLNASAAQWLIGNGRLRAPYRARQGTAIGRRGDVWIDEADGEIWVGGQAEVVISGTIEA